MRTPVSQKPAAALTLQFRREYYTYGPTVISLWRAPFANRLIWDGLDKRLIIRELWTVTELNERVRSIFTNNMLVGGRY